MKTVMNTVVRVLGDRVANFAVLVDRIHRDARQPLANAFVILDSLVLHAIKLVRRVTMVKTVKKSATAVTANATQLSAAVKKAISFAVEQDLSIKRLDLKRRQCL